MGDSISRQNAIEGVKELFACADIGNDECDITYMLENLPSVDRPTGEWVMKHDGIIFKRTWGVCSCCGNTLNFDGLNAGRGDANYCPNCGAKMKGGTE